MTPDTVGGLVLQAFGRLEAGRNGRPGDYRFRVIRATAAGLCHGFNRVTPVRRPAAASTAPPSPAPRGDPPRAGHQG
jgi:Mg2+/Co2+ transporter CorC